jgi:hypothetical protein
MLNNIYRIIPEFALTLSEAGISMPRFLFGILAPLAFYILVHYGAIAMSARAKAAAQAFDWLLATVALSVGLSGMLYTSSIFVSAQREFSVVQTVSSAMLISMSATIACRVDPAKLRPGELTAATERLRSEDVVWAPLHPGVSDGRRLKPSDVIPCGETPHLYEGQDGNRSSRLGTLYVSLVAASSLANMLLLGVVLLLIIRRVVPERDHKGVAGA